MMLSNADRDSHQLPLANMLAKYFVWKQFDSNLSEDICVYSWLRRKQLSTARRCSVTMPTIN
ncbi:hypothetical protein Plhal304r1_c015g0056101 [Plasmopara halstedii]